MCVDPHLVCFSFLFFNFGIFFSRTSFSSSLFSLFFEIEVLTFAVIELRVELSRKIASVIESKPCPLPKGGELGM